MAENIETVNDFMEELYQPSMTAAKIDIQLIADYAKKIDVIEYYATSRGE